MQEKEIIWLDSAIQDLVHLREFISERNPTSAIKAARVIRTAISKLSLVPKVGKAVVGMQGYYDLKIRFGSAGYVIRYHLYNNKVYIVQLRHYRQSGMPVLNIWQVQQERMPYAPLG